MGIEPNELPELLAAIDSLTVDELQQLRSALAALGQPVGDTDDTLVAGLVAERDALRMRVAALERVSEIRASFDGRTTVESGTVGSIDLDFIV